MKHVLVVEDDLMNARLFETVLRRLGGFDVRVTEDPGEILNLVRSGMVDLVVMDISLKGATYEGEDIDGVGLTQLIKQDERTSHIPVLLATAHAMHGDRKTLLAESGAEDYISKPIVDHRLFIEKVNSLMPGQAATQVHRPG